MASVIQRCRGGQVTRGSHGQAWPERVDENGRQVGTLTRYNPCVSAYQDTRYGAGMRVHSTCHGKNDGQVRCTVCGSGPGLLRP